MQKSLSFEELVRLEDMFDKFVQIKKACLSSVEKQESLLDFQCAFRDDDQFETLDQFEEAVFNGGAWEFKCDTTAPEDPQPKADAEDARRRKYGQEANNFGYIMKTTFWEDFTIADRFGAESVKDTFRRAFEEWQHDVIFLTELVLVLNWKIWQQHNAALNLKAKADEESRQADEARKSKDLQAAQQHDAAAQTAKRLSEQAEELANIYNNFWARANDYAFDNLKGSEITYFYNVTD